MVQMTPKDQAVVKALPGNMVCCDCGMKNPQWASVSFGNVFCLECSGIHRSLGVHISFVRSIAMDSWTDAQLAIMKKGGNDKLHDYLQKHGIGPRTPISQKYSSPAAQLYKQILKARAEGRPEPTEVIAPAPASAPLPPRGDPNGMERLLGETDSEYIARQTRLREEARARMAAKFASGGGLGGVGPNSSSSSRMAGIGSDPSYNPNSGYGGGYGSGDSSMNVDSLVTGLGSALGAVKSSVTSIIQEDNIQSLKAKGGSFWGSFASSVSQVASTISTTAGVGAGPDDSDGLADLQRQISRQKPSNSVYKGFGSDSINQNNNRNSPSSSFGGGNYNYDDNNNNSYSSSTQLQEAPGLPGEDRNGMERLTGESDEQYIMRQTRLREEARARMAAKFGGGGGMSLGGVGSNNYSSNTSSTTTTMRPPTSTTSYTPSPSSGNYNFATPHSATPPPPGSNRSAPTSGNAPPRSMTPPPPKTQINSNDFFSSFGT